LCGYIHQNRNIVFDVVQGLIPAFWYNHVDEAPPVGVGGKKADEFHWRFLIRPILFVLENEVE
jgi:hypothetical protein